MRRTYADSSGNGHNYAKTINPSTPQGAFGEYDLQRKLAIFSRGEYSETLGFWRGKSLVFLWGHLFKSVGYILICELNKL